MNASLSKLNLVAALFIVFAIATTMVGELSLAASLGAVWAAAVGCTYYHYAKRYL